MNNPGIKDLGDITVTAAGTQTTEWTDDLDGVTAVTSQARFAYRTGGTVAWSLSRPQSTRAPRKRRPDHTKEDHRRAAEKGHKA
jgi:hypothetical protein